MFKLNIEAFFRRNTGPRALLALLCLTIFGTQAWADEARYKQYVARSIEYARDLYESCPPRTCFIINFGASTAIASAYFRSVIPDLELRRRYYAELMIKDILPSLDNAQDESELQKILFEIFDQIIPPADVLNGRTVIIHRTLMFGATMNFLAKMLLKYKELRRPDLAFGVYLISDESFVFENLAPKSETHFVTVDRPYFLSYVHVFRFHKSSLLRFADTNLTFAQRVMFEQSSFGLPNKNRLELTSLDCQPLSHPSESP